nr:ribonuclease H-like domain-containing protein [Tanacetum cinerariifolium]
MADFHHLDDDREIWLAVKARFGGNEESKKMRKTMRKQGFSEFSAKPDNDDVNIKFLKALPSSWSQVALTLKTRGCLECLTFDDLYNKLRSLEIDLKGGSSYGSRSTTMAMLSLRSNKFQKKAGKKINFNNKDFARFDRRNARCYNCLQLRHFARECNVKKVDEKARYSAFKISEWEIKFVELLARFDKWQESSKNLVKLLYSSMSTRIKLGLGVKEYIRSDEVCDLFTPSVFDPEPKNKEVKSLYESDKSSASETNDFASYVLSPKTNDSFSTVDVKLLPKYDVNDPSPTNGLSSCSFKENVTPPRNLYQHLFMLVDPFLLLVETRSASIHAGRSIPAASRNQSAFIHAGRSIPADSRNRPASIHAG